MDRIVERGTYRLVIRHPRMVDGRLVRGLFVGTVFLVDYSKRDAFGFAGTLQNNLRDHPAIDAGGVVDGA